jgi:hypothetical protein
MTDLRWIERNVLCEGPPDALYSVRTERVLQMRYPTNPPSEWELSGIIWSDWEDVQVVSEITAASEKT